MLGFSFIAANALLLYCLTIINTLHILAAVFFFEIIEYIARKSVDDGICYKILGQGGSLAFFLEGIVDNFLTLSQCYWLSSNVMCDSLVDLKHPFFLKSFFIFDTSWLEALKGINVLC